MDFEKEQTARFKRLQKWLEQNELKVAVFLKEELESFNGNYYYYGGGKASGEYGAIIFDSSGGRTAIAHEYSFERVKSSGYYDEVLETRQSIDELALVIRHYLERKYPKVKMAIDQSASSNALRMIGGVKNNSLRDFVFRERSVKSRYEIGEMEIAIDVARRALERTMDRLNPGLTVEDLTVMLNRSMIEEGGSGNSFETDIRIRRGFDESEIEKIQSGDLVLFDFGTRIGSMYLSDIGRTIPYKPGEKAIEFMKQVCTIKREGLKKIKSGKSGNEVRADIDSLIKEHGFVSTHRPGHQIGLNVHEPYGPALAYGKENSGELREGNVVTWEPGIGIPSNRMHERRFGMAHMEDMILVGGNSKALGNLELEYF